MEFCGEKNNLAQNANMLVFGLIFKMTFLLLCSMLNAKVNMVSSSNLMDFGFCH